MNDSISTRGETGPMQGYVLGHSDRELNRLAVQARLVDPITRGFFQAAGIITGMRVLDVGSGAGDVAFLAAELVGETGEVVGVDRSATAVALARQRAGALSLRNVSFREGDPTSMTFEKAFDAVIGRYVLMFQPDPTMMLRGVAAHVRPGGVVVFHEPDWRCQLMNVAADGSLRRLADPVQTREWVSSFTVHSSGRACLRHRCDWSRS